MGYSSQKKPFNLGDFLNEKATKKTFRRWSPGASSRQVKTDEEEETQTETQTEEGKAEK